MQQKRAARNGKSSNESADSFMTDSSKEILCDDLEETESKTAKLQ